jgi:tetratricopeptide (TPR) repeat protein
MKREAVIIWGLVLLLLVPAGVWSEELFDLNASKIHFQKGLHYYFQKQYPAAVREFQETLRINPDDARSCYFLGYSYYQLREMQKAQEAFEQAYQMNPQYSPIPKAVTQD